MSTEVITSFGQQCDANGDPMSGAKVYVYTVSTTTLKTVYSDTGLSVSVANPIVCDSAGRHDMRYIASGSYKIVVKTSADVTVFTRDNIDGRVPVGSGALAIANGGTAATTAAAALSNLGGATAAELADVAADVAALAGAAASIDKTHIATGTTAQRPVSPIEGDIRRNTTTSAFEGYGASWVSFQMVTRTVQRFTSGTGATYTLPTACKSIRVRMCGPGGGGGARATNAGANGAADTSFDTWTAIKGNGGAVAAGDGGAGGTGGTDGTGTKIVRVDGGSGQGGTNISAGGAAGGSGGHNPFGGAGAKGGASSAGEAAKANTGAGGQGGNGTSTGTAGGGGGAGEYVEFLITAPAATYIYTVGGGGAGGAAGGSAGGNGAAGIIIVEEFY